MKNKRIADLDDAQRQLIRLHKSVEEMHRALLASEADQVDILRAIPADLKASARNLIHYLALRQLDLRELQRDLSALGLSSLGRCEANVLASVERIMIALASLAQLETAGPAYRPPVDHRSGPELLVQHANVLFGPEPSGRSARIMVTLSRDIVDDGQLVERLFDAGMDLARINCAHDDEQTWLAMIRAIRTASGRRRRGCPILMDLAGPKVRTGAIATGVNVVTWSPLRDRRGGMQQPARVELVADGAPPPEGRWDAWLPLDARILAECRPGDHLRFVDTRGKHRRLSIGAVNGRSVEAHATATAYVESGLAIHLVRSRRVIGTASIGPLPATEEPLLLSVGDILLVTAAQEPGRPARRNARGTVIEPASIPCTLPEVIADIRQGEHVWFDDGKLGGVVRSVDDGRLRVEITEGKQGGTRLRSDKGINFPDSQLTVGCLTSKDLEDLRFARVHADLIGLSFVRLPEDIAKLIAALGRGRRRPGIVLKIETPQGFANLPGILMRGLSAGPIGVMVARGDLAVEVGFARMAEVQEEILWLCESAHVPVIWGTQVLESLAKKGMATRAEVTDAAMSVRAECVMLNKGPFIVEAVRFLADVLTRMRSHQSKKRTLLRRLAVTQQAAARG
jgi:pyruvate kinase